jgi:hypothetical protein
MLMVWIRHEETRMPTNQHVAVLRPAEAFKSNTIKPTELKNGIIRMTGCLEGKASTVAQSYLFPTSLFGEDRAKKWLSRKGIKHIEFCPGIKTDKILSFRKAGLSTEGLSRILPIGKWHTNPNDPDHVFNVDMNFLNKLISQTQALNRKIIVDMRHEFGAKYGEAPPATLTAIEGDSLYVRINFTPLGKKLVESKEYEELSVAIGPEMDVNSGKRYSAVLQAITLTNIPKLTGTRISLSGQGYPRIYSFDGINEGKGEKIMKSNKKKRSPENDRDDQDAKEEGAQAAADVMEKLVEKMEKMIDGISVAEKGKEDESEEAKDAPETKDPAIAYEILEMLRGMTGKSEGKQAAGPEDARELRLALQKSKAESRVLQEILAKVTDLAVGACKTEKKAGLDKFMERYASYITDINRAYFIEAYNTNPDIEEVFSKLPDLSVLGGPQGILTKPGDISSEDEAASKVWGADINYVRRYH